MQRRLSKIAQDRKTRGVDVNTQCISTKLYELPLTKSSLESSINTCTFQWIKTQLLNVNRDKDPYGPGTIKSKTTIPEPHV